MFFYNQKTDDLEEALIINGRCASIPLTSPTRHHHSGGASFFGASGNRSMLNGKQLNLWKLYKGFLSI